MRLAAAPTKDSGLLQSVERACAVLEYLARCDEPQSATQVSRALEIERTTAHRLLKSLLKGGMVSNERAALYSIGPRALAIGTSYVEQMHVRRIALPYMMALSAEYAKRPWSVVLGVFDGEDILLVERLWNPKTPLNSLIEIGGKMPVDRTAAGWAYLAQLSDQDATRIVGAPRFVEILPKLHEARDSHGLAFASGELQPGIDALAAPVIDSSGRVAAVVIVGGSDFHDELHAESEIALHVRRIVTCVSDTLAKRR
jgi:IclR family acetate operon transcriptional repressor